MQRKKEPAVLPSILTFIGDEGISKFASLMGTDLGWERLQKGCQ